MTTVPEDRLDPDWEDYEGVIGYDTDVKEFTVQLCRHFHYFDDRESAEQWLEFNR